MKKKSFFKKIWRFLVDNYFLSIFFASIGFVGLISIYKLFFVKPTYVYAKIKVGQGLWWASTQKPSIWFIEGLKKAKEEYTLLGQPQAQILSIRYYPSYIRNQYDVYLIMKLQVQKLGKTEKYNFKRSSIGVGSPVDFEFPQAQFSGTIIKISEKPIKEIYQEKIIYLSKPYAYPFEYENIQIGDSFFDGKEKIVEILDKKIENNSIEITSQKLSKILDKQVVNLYKSQNYQQILVKLKIKVKKEADNLIFAEEQIIKAGNILNIATKNFQFFDYVIAKIE